MEFYKMYTGYLMSAKEMKDDQVIEDIQIDLERTF